MKPPSKYDAAYVQVRTPPAQVEQQFSSSTVMLAPETPTT
jgi:hypothetical protein